MNFARVEVLMMRVLISADILYSYFGVIQGSSGYLVPVEREGVLGDVSWKSQFSLVKKLPEL